MLQSVGTHVWLLRDLCCKVRALVKFMFVFLCCKVQASVGLVQGCNLVLPVGNSGAEPMPVAKLAYGLVRRLGTASCVSLV